MWYNFMEWSKKLQSIPEEDYLKLNEKDRQNYVRTCLQNLDTTTKALAFIPRHSVCTQTFQIVRDSIFLVVAIIVNVGCIYRVSYWRLT